MKKENRNLLSLPIDRRDALKMFTMLTGAAALSQTVVGCKSQKAAFEAADPKVIAAGARLMASTMQGYTSKATTNQQAMEQSAEMIKNIGLANSALYGATADLNQFGHVVIINAGPRGFIRVEVHNDKSYVEPLIIKRGQRPFRFGASVGCTITKICTNTIDLGGGPSTHDFDDQGAEDPGTGLLQNYVFTARSAPDPREIDFHGEVIKKSAELLEVDLDASTLSQWIREKTAGLDKTQAYVSVSNIQGVPWYDWLLVFSNGSSAIVQVAKGQVQPVHAMGAQMVDPSKASISYDTLPTNVVDHQIAFPHVTQRF